MVTFPVPSPKYTQCLFYQSIRSALLELQKYANVVVHDESTSEQAYSYARSLQLRGNEIVLRFRQPTGDHDLCIRASDTHRDYSNFRDSLVKTKVFNGRDKLFQLLEQLFKSSAQTSAYRFDSFDGKEFFMSMFNHGNQARVDVQITLA